MQTESSLRPPGGTLHDRQDTCPLCHWKLIRQRRRPVDRLWSLIQPVKRYRCENFSCQWVGNVASARTESATAGQATNPRYGGDTAERPPRVVPVTFVVHMVLVAVGIVFVLVYSTMEPTSLFDDTDTATDTSILEWTAERSVNRADAR